jgi:nucleoside-diphosphate-sugar epimerase
MKICVTGASGFIGSNLCYYLKNLGHEVYPICSHTCKISDDFGENTRFIGMFGFDTNILKHVDGIMHLSANNDTLSNQSSEMLRANFYDSKNLLKYSIKYRHKFFIYASSTAVYGKTSNVITEDIKPKANTIYSKSKLKFDKFIVKTNPRLRWTGLRLCNIYGPNEIQKTRRSSYLNQILDNMIANKDVYLFEDGTQQRDWCYVEDVCSAFTNAINNSKNGIYNIASGQAVSFIDLFNECAKVTGYKKSPIFIENKYKNQYQNKVIVDISTASKYLSYVPKYNIAEGIKTLYELKINNI